MLTVVFMSCIFMSIYLYGQVSLYLAVRAATLRLRFNSLLPLLLLDPLRPDYVICPVPAGSTSVQELRADRGPPFWGRMEMDASTQR